MPTSPARRSPVGQLRDVLAWRDTRLLALLFLITQALDVLTTERALQTQRFREGNPWLNQVTAAHPLLVYAAKLFVGALVLTALLLLRLRWRLRLAVMITFILASLVAPVTNALRVDGLL